MILAVAMAKAIEQTEKYNQLKTLWLQARQEIQDKYPDEL